MARKRVFDGELYFDSELVGLLGSDGLHLYFRLWGLAEDWGGYEPKYADISLRMGALKISASKVESLIKKLIDVKKIIEYERNGKKYHWIVNLMKHQPLDKPALPHLPLPEWITHEVKEYKSGKKYAAYTIIPEKVPVQYENSTSTVPELPKRNETETKRNETETKQKHMDAVFLTSAEYEQLVQRFGKDGADERIKQLDNYMGSKGKKYLSHYKTILVWEDKEQKEIKNGKSKRSGFVKGDNTAGSVDSSKYDRAGIPD